MTQSSALNTQSRISVAGSARASEHWYAVCCKPRQEAVAEENLLRQSYRTYLPRICNMHHRKGQWVDKVEAL